MTDATQPRRRRRVDGFALFWAAPAGIWQGLFFAGPLVVLVSMSFWVVRNFRLTPDFDLGNWERMLSRDFFWSGYAYTFQMAALVAVLASIIAFPAAQYLAFRASPGVRRLAIFLLVTPFFTSYLVRVYSWKIILSTEGVLNVMFGWLGLGPFGMIDNAFGACGGLSSRSVLVRSLSSSSSSTCLRRPLADRRGPQSGHAPPAAEDVRLPSQSRRPRIA